VCFVEHKIINIKKKFQAKKYPDVQFVCFSNSKTQKQFITEQAKERGISNLKVVKADINDMSLEALGENERFDRCVSIECLVSCTVKKMFSPPQANCTTRQEHSKNYEEIFARVRGMLNPNGRCFFQLLCHRKSNLLWWLAVDFILYAGEYSYHMSNDSWMGRNFFTGAKLRPPTSF
jgi:cyclopropane-fatty-acyl-phospholipid synthase